MKEQKRKNYTLVVEFEKVETKETGSFLFPDYETVTTTKTIKQNLKLTKEERDNKELIRNYEYQLRLQFAGYVVTSVQLIRNYYQ